MIKDYCLWAKNQSQILRERDFSRLDVDNMIEEIESLGNSEADKLESHLTNCLMHMLKNEYQEVKFTRSWDLSIKEALMRAKRVLSKNPSLKHKINEIYQDAYSTARLKAARETELEEKIFPVECPWEIDQLIKE